MLCVGQDFRQMDKKAAKLLLKLIEDPSRPCQHEAVEALPLPEEPVEGREERYSSTAGDRLGIPVSVWASEKS